MRGIVFLFIFIVAIVAGIMAGNRVEPTVESQYKGEYLFTDQQEYEEFKHDLITRDDIYIERLNTLSSEEHFVQFNIFIKDRGDFAWGERTTSYERIQIMMAYFAGIALSCIVALVVCLGLHSCLVRGENNGTN